jgi:hypothetical protein
LISLAPPFSAVTLSFDLAWKPFKTVSLPNQSLKHRAKATVLMKMFAGFKAPLWTLRRSFARILSFGGSDVSGSITYQTPPYGAAFAPGGVTRFGRGGRN